MKNKKIINIQNLKNKKIDIKNTIETNHLYVNKKIKKVFFLKKPLSKNINYPFFLNLSLVNEFLKKK